MVNTYVFGNIPNKTDIEISRRWGEGLKISEFFSGEVSRDDYPNVDDYEKQNGLLAEAGKEKGRFNVTTNIRSARFRNDGTRS